MKVFFGLIKIYFSSFFNSLVREGIKKRKISDKASMIKKIFVVLMTSLVGLVIVFLFGFYSYALYSGAKALNNIKLFFEISTLIVSFFIVLFGFMSIISTYYIGEIEEQFLSMPIKPRTLFSAKFATSYFSNIYFSVSFFVAMMAVYGYFEKPNFIFYIWGLLCSILIPLPIIAVFYFITIFLMRYVKIFRNKNLVVTINLILSVGFAVGFQYIAQSARFENIEQIYQNLLTGQKIFDDYGKFYPPIKLVGRILSEPATFQATTNFLLLFLLCTILPALLIFSMSKIYAESLLGFSEKMFKRLDTKERSAFLDKKLKQLPPLLSYTKREFVLMNRNPVYLFNGPFKMIIVPLVFGVIIFAKKKNLQDLLSVISPYVHSGFGFVSIGLIVSFFAVTTNIASTALSRDAKFIPVIKSLPVNFSEYMFGKFLHAMIFSLLGSIVFTGIFTFIFKLELLNIVLAFFVSLAFSCLLNLLALFLDTLHPMLKWDNPVAPIKQNINSTIVTFINFAFFALAAFLLFLNRTANLWILVLYFIGIPSVLFVALLKPYAIFAQRQVSKIEL